MQQSIWLVIGEVPVQPLEIPEERNWREDYTEGTLLTLCSPGGRAVRRYATGEGSATHILCWRNGCTKATARGKKTRWKRSMIIQRNSV